MELVQSIIFYLIAVILVLSVLVIVISKKVMHCTIASFISFLLTGILFLSLNALFSGIVQILICAVALCILFISTIKNAGYIEEISLKKSVFSKMILFFTSVVIIYSVIAIIKLTCIDDYSFMQYLTSSHILLAKGNTNQLSNELINKNYYNFEFFGLYLLVFMSGISVLYAYKRGNGE